MTDEQLIKDLWKADLAHREWSIMTLGLEIAVPIRPKGTRWDQHCLCFRSTVVCAFVKTNRLSIEQILANVRRAHVKRPFVWLSGHKIDDSFYEWAFICDLLDSDGNWK